MIDYVANLVRLPVTGMTDYMFEKQRSLFLRGLSLFHGWLPFLLLYLVWRMGYDPRALTAWTCVVLHRAADLLFPDAAVAARSRPDAGQYQFRLRLQRSRAADLDVAENVVC